MVGHLAASAQVLQDGHEETHILQLGHVVDDRLTPGQQGRRHQRQHGVLGSAHRDFALQTGRPLDYESVHVNPPDRAIVH